MGIRGLTTYIANRSDYYLEPFALHNTNLVIDGWSLSSQLYCNVARCNCTFGGDYDQFAHCVSQFFEELLRCEVKPLVLLDGGWENKKKATIITRLKDRLNSASRYGPLSQHRHKFFPLLIPEVFIDVMRQMDIKFVMCTYEADDCIAAVARILNCPVLSYDSDFYIYGVEYIPFNTLDPFVAKYAKGYVKRCKIYRPEKLLKKFRGLDISVLPLASILLGNDYINRSTFSGFFRRLKLRKNGSQNEQQRRIEGTFNWLRNHSLNSAVAVVLKRLLPEKRERILKLIESIINSYSNLSTYMLRPLGFSEKFISEAKKNEKSFKFCGDIEKLDDIEIDVNEEESESDDCLEDEIEDNEKIEEEQDNVAEDKFAASVPEWFMSDHLSGRFPVYFVNILTHRMYILQIQIEDFHYPSAHEISLPIITTICSLLTTSNSSIVKEEEETVIQLLKREKNKLSRQFLTIAKSPVALEDIRDLKIADRKKIINNLLQIRCADRLEEYPESWKLYVAAILFWMRQKVGAEKTKIHLDTLLVVMLLGIIDKTIGFKRSKNTFERKFRDELARIQDCRRTHSIVGDHEATVLAALVDSVNKDDCIAAAPFFLAHFEMDERLRSYPKKFCVTIVHVFAEFQSCLRHLMHLNALIGYVYAQPSLGDFFNGTLLYNLFNNFSSRADVHDYISTRLRNSPGLLKIFLTMSKRLLNALQDFEIDEGVKNLKRRRHRSRKCHKEEEEEEEDEEEEYLTAEDDLETNEKNFQFYDPINPFSLLGVA